MDIQKELQLSLNDDNGSYNFVVKRKTVLSIDINQINNETENDIFDGLISIMGVTLSTVSEITKGKLLFYTDE